MNEFSLKSVWTCRELSTIRRRSPAYMVSLGIESALDLADKSNARLMSTLEATLALAKSAMWELRRPLNMGGIFEGKMISDVLGTHIRTFTAITSVPANLEQSGEEPSLDVETRSVLFLIAHNALTNAISSCRGIECVGRSRVLARANSADGSR